MSPRPILLDTHAALWMPDEGRLSLAAEAELMSAREDGRSIFISPISAWEIGLLVARGRVALPTAPGPWLDALIELGLSWAPLTPEILIASSFLPGQMHGDPADRVLVATARTLGYQLMTRDRRLLSYAEAGHLLTTAC